MNLFQTVTIVAADHPNNSDLVCHAKHDFVSRPVLPSPRAVQNEMGSRKESLDECDRLHKSIHRDFEIKPRFTPHEYQIGDCFTPCCVVL